MVSTITESFFQQHLRGKLQFCRWLQLRAANGLEIPYVGYVELPVEVLGKLIPDRGWLVVKDPPGSAGSVAVPGVLGMNVIRECYHELFGQHGSSLFGLPPVVHASPPWQQALQYCHQTSDGLLISTSLVKVARGTVYVPVVNVGQTRVALHPRCPLGLLSQAQVVSLPAGVTEVVSEVPAVVALAQAQVVQASPILEQIEGLDLSSLSSEEQMRVKSLLQNYYRRFIQGFSKLAGPLHHLVAEVGGTKTRKGQGPCLVDAWSQACEFSFQELKSKLVNAPTLAFANFSLPFILEVDASHQGLGAVLSQEQDG
ncbi:hypothetical protein MHYP_G00170700 [Metynnis hypsauchen]